MKRSLMAVAWTAAAAAMCAPGHAQTKEIPGETITVKGTVEAIDHQARAVTIRREDGEFTTIDVPKGASRFHEIKVGDEVQARYYDNVVVRLKKPGEAEVNRLEGALTPGAGAKPGATAAAQYTMTATVEAIDPKVPSIKFKGPKGWSYSRKVQDKKALEQVKVGDKVDFTWTEAVTIEILAPKK